MVMLGSTEEMVRTPLLFAKVPSKPRTRLAGPETISGRVYVAAFAMYSFIQWICFIGRISYTCSFHACFSKERSTTVGNCTNKKINVALYSSVDVVYCL